MGRNQELQTKMFSEEYMYEAKAMLRSVKESYNTLEEAAEKKAEMAHFSNAFQRLIDAKKSGQIEVKAGQVSKGSNFEALREYKLYQFSKHLMEKYLPTYKSSHDYQGTRDALQKGITDLQKDISS